ncbi:hypothetical protein PRZ48_007725 [Zasmidium cellare]|uniref:Uncharacterized protein n=1 Tax=Zasmidium cellare TaxID=395010 RepID=A0ABR0EK39_ZASCE|nr:hypothetical protein PRZ48_007725 [Zasmidium cellare]
MKLAVVFFGMIAAATALNIQHRQNDVPDCVDGSGNGESYNTGAECQENCFGTEDAEGDNYGGICKLSCTPRPLPGIGGRYNTVKFSYGQATLNLTVTFYPDTGESCNSTSSGISFTTSSIPPDDECFNLADLFSGNSTFGFRNQTPSTIFPQDPIGLSWSIQNADAYDAQANYSYVLYQQPLANEEDGEAGKTDASKYFSVYNAPGCTATGDEEVQPWVGWTCATSASGDCGALPYSVASFKVDDATALNQRKGQASTGPKDVSFDRSTCREDQKLTFL